MKDDGTFEVQVKITRGTDNPDYQQPLEEAWLFVSQIDYVSNAPGAYSTKLSTNLTQADLRNYTLGDILTIRTGYLMDGMVEQEILKRLTVLTNGLISFVSGPYIKIV